MARTPGSSLRADRAPCRVRHTATATPIIYSWKGRSGLGGSARDLRQGPDPAGLRRASLPCLQHRASHRGLPNPSERSFGFVVSVGVFFWFFFNLPGVAGDAGILPWSTLGASPRIFAAPGCVCGSVCLQISVICVHIPGDSGC